MNYNHNYQTLNKYCTVHRLMNCGICYVREDRLRYQFVHRNNKPYSHPNGNPIGTPDVAALPTMTPIMTPIMTPAIKRAN